MSELEDLRRENKRLEQEVEQYREALRSISDLYGEFISVLVDMLRQPPTPTMIGMLREKLESILHLHQNKEPK